MLGEVSFVLGLCLIAKEMEQGVTITLFIIKDQFYKVYFTSSCFKVSLTGTFKKIERTIVMWDKNMACTPPYRIQKLVG